jgi:DNA-binding CsgD family transcriptional regulator
MAEIAGDLNSMGSALLVHDLRGLPPIFLYSWGNDPIWLERYGDYAGEVAALFKNAPDVLTGPIDTPLVLSRSFDEQALATHRVYRDWAAPQGICDFIQTTALRDQHRIGFFSAYRHERIGQYAECEIEIMRCLAPHIRRAVTISDLMDLRKLEVRAIAAALDNLSVGVIIVADNSGILHANDAAQSMFKAGEPVRSAHGRLFATNSDAGRELAEAIALARRDDVAIGATGIGIALKGNSQAAVAYVLPLTYGDLRTRLMPQATAAVFVTRTESGLPVDVGAIARHFDLTNAEARLLERMTPSTTLIDLAKDLGISEVTARTHLSRIFAKTGVSRQADLFALLASLTARVRRPDRKSTGPSQIGS